MPLITERPNRPRPQVSACLFSGQSSGRGEATAAQGPGGIRGDQRCAEVMRAVGLDPALPRRVGQYSQGMRQRLSLARAILNDPVVVLLD